MSHGEMKTGYVIFGDVIFGDVIFGDVIYGDVIFESKRGWSQVAAGLRSPFRQKGPTSARTAIRHGVMRVLKMSVDDGVGWARRADAQPLAGCEVMFIIRCPDTSSRDWAAGGSPRCGLRHRIIVECMAPLIPFIFARDTKMADISPQQKSLD